MFERRSKTVDEVSRQIVKQVINITDADLDRLSPGMKKLLSDLPEKMKWRIVAEVTESKYCFAGLKPGDKFVFNFPVLNVAESTAAPCIEAIAPLTSQIRAMVDRVAEGSDPNESIFATQQVPCMDVGVEHGGLGRVMFKLYAERAG
jgi:uncharacterized repeat protein (TIGR04076 family)